MKGIIEIQLASFLLIYLLLLIVLFVMKSCKIHQSKLLIVASIRMTVQLVLAGYILTYIFKNPRPVFTIAYVGMMTVFAIYRVLKKNPGLSRNFQLMIALSMSVSGIGVLLFFVAAVVGESILNPQYVIPVSGMVMGNTMTGVALGVKSFQDRMKDQGERIEALMNIGAHPRTILLPFVRGAIETALLPTLNSMVGMGVVSLPGMMTGQILSGTLPMTAILYQIAIMAAICAAVCLSCFGALYLGFRTLWNEHFQINCSLDRL